MDIVAISISVVEQRLTSCALCGPCGVMWDTDCAVIDSTKYDRITCRYETGYLLVAGEPVTITVALHGQAAGRSVCLVSDQGPIGHGTR